MIREENYRKGDVIYRQGEEAGEIFFVKFGTVELFLDYKTPDQKLIGSVSEGKVFGELGVIEEKPRSMTSVAAEETVVTIVDKEAFPSYIKENPNKLILIMESLSSRIRTQSQKLVKACRTVADYAEKKEANGEADEELLQQMKILAKENIRNKS